MFQPREYLGVEMVPELTEADEIVSGYVAAHELKKLVHSEALLLLGPYLSIECLVEKDLGVKICFSAQTKTQLSILCK